MHSTRYEPRGAIEVAVDDAVASKLQALAESIELLARQRGSGAIGRTCAGIARRLAQCDAVLLLGSRTNDRIFSDGVQRDAQLSAYAAALDEQLPNSSLQLHVSAGQGGPTALIVPVSTNAARAMGFVWMGERVVDHHTVAILRGLASVFTSTWQLDLALEDRNKLREHLNRQLGDVQHRLRNILAFIRSIVRRTQDSAQSSEDFALHLESRISAVSRIQASLNVHVATGVDLQELVRAELVANAVPEWKVLLSGPAVRLHARAAENMGLMLHELATNSLKFGAFKGESGEVRIDWSVVADTQGRWLRFRWLEEGVSVTATAPRHRGFGQVLIEETLEYELGAKGQLELRPGGVRCVVDLPLNARTSNSIHFEPDSDGGETDD